MSGSSKPGETNAVETFDQLWGHVENDLRVEIPEYIKNILLISGFDNRLTIRSLSEKDIDHLEMFARSDEYYCRVKFSREAYYGVYANREHKHFKIPPGHRRLLACVVDHLKHAHHHSVKIE